jgi:lauroyl/myristoyl acyltransferase
MRIDDLTSAPLLKLDEILYHKFVVPAVAFLPAPLAYGVAVVHADVLYSLRDDLRRELEDRMQLVLGEQLTTIERKRASRNFVRIRSCERVDQVRLLGSGRALLGLVKVRGKEHIEAALARGKGAILCSAHFGSPTCCFSVLGAHRIPITLIARWSYPKDLESSPMRRFINRIANNVPFTSHLQGPNIERKHGRLAVAFQAATVLRKNEVVGVMIDSVLKPGDPSKPVTVDFLDHKAILVPGAVTIAQLTGAPLLIMMMRRDSDMRHQVLEISPPILIDKDTIVSYQRCLAVIDAAIRKYPAQWAGWDSPDLVRMGLIPQPKSTKVRKWEDWALKTRSR